MYNIEFVVAAMADIADECDNRGLYSEADELTSIINMISKVAEISKEAYVKAIKQKGKTKYQVKSKKNPDWSGGIYSSRAEAEKRLAEVEMFKHMKKRKKRK
jgi:hypothetical protein